MIVDHFNTTSTGGAALAALRLHESLADFEVESRLWCSPKNATKPNLSSDDWRPANWRQPAGMLARTSAWLQNEYGRWRKKQQHKTALASRPAGSEYFSFADLGRATEFDPASADGDILHLHWVAQLIDYASFFASLADDQPIVWTLHDMHPITGGCHHADACDKFHSACVSCPQLNDRAAADYAAESFRTKQKAYAHRQIHFAAPSQWIADAASASALTAGASVHTIRHGVNTNTFQPADKRAAKQRLGVNPDKVVIGFGADAVSNPRKGMNELQHALTAIGEKTNVACITFGNGVPAAMEKIVPLVHCGFVNDPARLAEIYVATDVFVFPTYAESCGMTGVEALACETPVVAFNAVGVNEYVLHEQTGLIAPLHDSSALAHAIGRLIENETLRRQLGRNGRELVRREFEQQAQAKKYVELYRQILEEKQRSNPQAA